MKPVTTLTVWSIGLAATLLWAAPVCDAWAFDPIVVVVDIHRIAPRDDAAPRLAQVHLTDVRPESGRELERTTIGGISMGAIRLDPSAPDIVKAIVESKADAVLSQRAGREAQAVDCGLFAFELATPATLLYWDIRARIEVGLRVQDRERTISASITERTFVWPSQELIARVTTGALERLSVEAERALSELLVPPR